MSLYTVIVGFPATQTVWSRVPLLCGSLGLLSLDATSILSFVIRWPCMTSPMYVDAPSHGLSHGRVYPSAVE